MRVRHCTVACAILRRPLVCPSRALGEFPFVLEQVLEVVVAPLGWRGGPNDFQAASDCVTSFARAKCVSPAETLLLHAATFWFRADILGLNRSAVSFAECMPASDQRDGFLVVHRHAAEGFANVTCRSNWIRLSVGSFRIHVDQAHLNGAERIRQLTIATVALVSQPCAFWSPV